MVRLSLNPSLGVAGEGASCTAGKESETLEEVGKGEGTQLNFLGESQPLSGPAGELKTLGKVGRSVPS